MSIYDFNKAAKLAGFSKILGASSRDFILFDKDTDGRSGRPIFINGALANKFNNFKKFSEIQYAFHRIKQLRALAGGITSYSNNNDAMEHMLVVGRAKITYKLFAATNDPGSKPGVYITDLDMADFADHEPGIYKTIKKAESWDVGGSPESYITSSVAAINGLCDDLRQAAGEIMPSILESAYGPQNDYDLFYNPPALFKDGKEWKTPQQKLRGQVMTELLARALKDCQLHKQEVKWVVHGDGARLLRKTLEKVGGADLSNHTLMFMAPMDTVADILPMARRSKMNLHQDVMKINDDDLESQRHQWGRDDRKKLGSELRQYGMDDKAYTLTNTLRKRRISTGKAMLTVGGAAFSAGSLLSGIPALTVGGAVGGAFTAATALDTAQTIRNRMAASITNPAYNPHLNPHKSVEELNLAARKASGGLAKTFVDVVRARIKG